MGEECALIICGAEREEEDDRDRVWLLAKGDRVRGRMGRFAERLAKGGGAKDEPGAFARRGLSGRDVDGGVCVATGGRGGIWGLSSTSMLRGDNVTGGSVTRGTISIV